MCRHSMLAMVALVVLWSSTRSTFIAAAARTSSPASPRASLSFFSTQLDLVNDQYDDDTENETARGRRNSREEKDKPLQITTTATTLLNGENKMSFLSSSGGVLLKKDATASVSPANIQRTETLVDEDVDNNNNTDNRSSDNNNDANQVVLTGSDAKIDGLLDDGKVVKKRSYYNYPWQGQVVQTYPYESIAVWHPSIYQANRPYYIPIYAPQPSYPPPYPPPSYYYYPPNYQGPGYLPPKNPATQKPPGDRDDGTQRPPSLDNRFNGIDDRPVWDLVPPVPQEPPNNGIVPTRRPFRPNTTPFPPLLHGGDEPGVPESGIGNNGGFLPGPPPTRPPPPRDNNNRNNTRPVSPGQSSPTPPRVIGPSSCVWAIVSCCSASSGEIRYDCFEQRGCAGAFWDRSPCDNEFARAAIESALNYYGENGK